MSFSYLYRIGNGATFPLQIAYAPNSQERSRHLCRYWNAQHINKSHQPLLPHRQYRIEHFQKCNIRYLQHSHHPLANVLICTVDIFDSLALTLRISFLEAQRRQKSTNRL